MDFKVVLSEFFVADLKEIFEFLADNAGSEVAIRIATELLDHAMDLASNPFVGQLVKQRPGVRKVLRFSYLIFYRVDEVPHRVEVLRVWHAHRDPKSLRL